MSTIISMPVNGISLGFFKNSRGLKQGDLLSPFLFILMAAVLSRLVMEDESKCLVEGCTIVWLKGLSVQILQFADDALLFLQNIEDHFRSAWNFLAL